MPNRLADAPSPYLQQHKDNPVHWWPWCDEAFEEARRRDVPVFLSIGYATCHWCHVMAHESFEDAEVADLLNQAFVCIKVDREERPDIDDTYMQACLATNGSGGWPLTAVIDHDLRPFFLGTYFPKTSRPGRIGMMDLVPRIAAAWKDRRDELTASSAHLMEHLQRPAHGPGQPDEGAPAKAAEMLVERATPEGGFGPPPLFPSLHNTRLLLRMGGDAREAALAQLRAMARAGIRDHVGGGFHRYATDADWHLPHFEKMLYDQGMALLAYAEAMMLAPDPAFEDVLRTVAAYLARDMQDPCGAYYAAEDADAEGEEGRFTTWPWSQLVDLVGEDMARALGARPEGNFHDEATGQPVDRNILYDATGDLRTNRGDAWNTARARLLATRDQRVRPQRDDKILADWNGLAAAGLAAAGRALGDEALIGQAKACIRGAGRLLGAGDDGAAPGGLRHTCIDGHRSDNLFAEDLAGFAFAHAHIARATGDLDDAARALAFLEALDTFQTDDGLYRRSPAGKEVLMQSIDRYDGATPSTNTLAAEADLIVSRLLTARPPPRTDAILAALATDINDRPLAVTGLIAVLHDRTAPHAEVITVAREPGPFNAVTPMRPDVYAANTAPGATQLLRHRDFIGDEEPRAYVCRGDACETAAKTPQELEAALVRVLRATSA